MPATYEVRGGIAYPPRQKFTGPLCPECRFRGRHMPWCKTGQAEAAPPPASPDRAQVEAEIRRLTAEIAQRKTTTSPAKKARGLPAEELAYIESELDWARSRGWEVIADQIPPHKDESGHLLPAERIEKPGGLEVYRKLLKKNARRRQAYLAAGLADPARKVTSGAVRYYQRTGPTTWVEVRR